MTTESGVDPRVQIELEKLNSATDNINKYEVELDEAKGEFKKLLAESQEKIKKSSQKLSNSIEAARPYYEARLFVAQLGKETQQAAANYEKAKSVHAAAKEMVYLAEQGLGEKSTLDTACQEMLSHAASRVNESQLECTETRNVLKICELKQEVSNNRVLKLQSQLKTAIKASSYNFRRTLLLNLLPVQRNLLSLPYYETRANYNGFLKQQKEKISSLESKVTEAKLSYNEALKNLEQISEEIHRMRQERLNFNHLTLNFDSLTSQQELEQEKLQNCNRKNSRHDDDDEDDIYNYRSNNLYSSQIDNADEYLELPPKLSIDSSPVRQKRLDRHDSPHLLHDFESAMKFTNDSAPSQYESNSANDEQWTEIRLSESESTSSGYSGRHNLIMDHLDDQTPTGSDLSSSDDQKKITCTNVFNGSEYYTDDDTKNDSDKSTKNKKNNESGITSWITRSNSFKSSGRRQSLDLLLDAGDRVKDVFASSIQKVGKSLERRNSEETLKQSESNDFFSFARNDKDQLTDEQIENIMLYDENDFYSRIFENGAN